jgi:uncharacterized membrane protein YfcA
MITLFTILSGIFVGFTLGLTGGGGSIFAVPLLVYGLGVPAREAFGISLASVGTMALIGVIPLVYSRLADVKTGLIFAVAGMLGAPMGTWTAHFISEQILLILFAILMVTIAVHMWRSSNQIKHELQVIHSSTQTTCQRTPQGRLLLNTPCAMLLLCVGLISGFLSGMFGVGGGFIIVPALILFSRMSIHQAVATSLFIIVLISISGVISHMSAGSGLSFHTTVLFIIGGIMGLFAGRKLSGLLSGPVLQKTFACGIIVTAMFIGIRSTFFSGV